MYSLADSFSVAGDQKVKILACRPEFRRLATRAPASEKAVIAAAKKCGIDF
jgi:hypothetical protein